MLNTFNQTAVGKSAPQKENLLQETVKLTVRSTGNGVRAILTGKQSQGRSGTTHVRGR